MAKPDIVVGLDVGSSQVVCLIAQRDPETDALQVVGGARRACRGLKGGVVINIDETAHAVARAVEEAEGMADLVGAIEPDKFADMVIVDGDPLKDVTILQEIDRIKMVMKGGQVVV